MPEDAKNIIFHYWKNKKYRNCPARLLGFLVHVQVVQNLEHRGN